MRFETVRVTRSTRLPRLARSAAVLIAVSLVLAGVRQSGTPEPDGLLSAANALTPSRLPVGVRPSLSSTGSLSVEKIPGAQVAVVDDSFAPPATANPRRQLTDEDLRNLLVLALQAELPMDAPTAGDGIPPLTGMPKPERALPSEAPVSGGKETAQAAGGNLVARGWSARRRGDSVEVLRHGDETSAIVVSEGMALGELGTIVEITSLDGQLVVRTSLGGEIKGAGT